MYSDLLNTAKKHTDLRRLLGRTIMAAREYVHMLVEFEWAADEGSFSNDELAAISHERGEKHEQFIRSIHDLAQQWSEKTGASFPPFTQYDSMNRSSLDDLSVALVKDVAQLAVDHAREPGRTVKL